jgi:hypothetical protein
MKKQQAAIEFEKKVQAEENVKKEKEREISGEKGNTRGKK